MLADVIVNHLRDLGYAVSVSRAPGFVGMTATKDGHAHVVRGDDDGPEGTEWAAIELARACGVDVEDG